MTLNTNVKPRELLTFTLQQILPGVNALRQQGDKWVVSAALPEMDINPNTSFSSKEEIVDRIVTMYDRRAGQTQVGGQMDVQKYVTTALSQILPRFDVFTQEGGQWKLKAPIAIPGHQTFSSQDQLITELVRFYGDQYGRKAA